VKTSNPTLLEKFSVVEFFAKISKQFSQPFQANSGVILFLYMATPLLKRLVAGFPPGQPGFDLWSDQVGFAVDKVALERVFSEYFGFPCQSLFHQILHHHNHPGQATIGQSVAAVPSGHSWTPPTLSEFSLP
jgi:hypothetical protein